MAVKMESVYRKRMLFKFHKTFDQNEGLEPIKEASAEVSPFQHRLSREEWLLLDAMGSHPIAASTGKFLTMHKRRRKKLTTRSLLADHAMLDDINHGQVQEILDRCGEWAFNAFALETAAGGRSLPVLCVHLFHWYGLLDHFQLDAVQVWKLFTLIEEGYHSTNPYHNSIHATDVTQAMHCFLQEEKIRKHMTPLEIMASLIGAVAHDLDHPGVNQHFLISTSNHLAILYQNTSVLENHHWRSAIGCLLESGLAEQLRPYRSELEHQIRELILATDINRQPEFLSRFKRHLDEDSLDLRQAEHRRFVMQIALKCADISNPSRPWPVSRRWSEKVCDEFFRQGEFERQLNLPVTAICDRRSTSVAKIQVGFFKIVVTPLFDEWHRFLGSALSTRLMVTLAQNESRWKQFVRAEEARTEPTEAEVAMADGEESPKRSSGTPSVQDFMPHPARDVRRHSLAVPTAASLGGGRRHSVPAPSAWPPPLPGAACRRESLPGAAPRLPPTPQSVLSRASSGLREEEGLPAWAASPSDGSEGSPMHSAADDEPERPLSAEHLLPEPSIASMTSSEAVGRLTCVLLASTPSPRCLARQQTFPPPQPYSRARYMSATAEMAACRETPQEEDSPSSSSRDSREENISAWPPQYAIPSIAVLSPINGRPVEVPPPPEAAPRPSPAGKREPEGGDKEKACKMAKLSEPEQRHQKENVDPRRLPATSLMRRRGSAPVTLPLSRPDEKMPPAGGGLLMSDLQSLRRGSVPIEIAHHQPTDHHHDSEEEEEGSPPSSRPLVTPVDASRSFWHQQRRGSAPAAPQPPPPATVLLTRHPSLNGRARRHQQRAAGRRRGSGGNRSPDGGGRLLLLGRRGSLPVEVLPVGHSVF